MLKQAFNFVKTKTEISQRIQNYINDKYKYNILTHEYIKNSKLLFQVLIHSLITWENK